MTGIGDAAAAILRVQPAAGMFPVIGVLTRLSIHRDPVTGTGALSTITNIAVLISGRTYACGCGGAFIAEVSALTGATGDGQEFLGRQVKVELIGGDLIVAYTVNWS